MLVVLEENIYERNWEFFILETIMYLFILLENIEMPSLLVERAAKCTMRPDFYDLWS